MLIKRVQGKVLLHDSAENRSILEMLASKISEIQQVPGSSIARLTARVTIDSEDLQVTDGLLDLEFQSVDDLNEFRRIRAFTSPVPNVVLTRVLAQCQTRNCKVKRMRSMAIHRQWALFRMCSRGGVWMISLLCRANLVLPQRLPWVRFLSEA
jgi:hypothetical protein